MIDKFIELFRDLIDGKTMVIFCVTLICILVIFRDTISAEAAEITKMVLTGLFSFALGIKVGERK